MTADPPYAMKRVATNETYTEILTHTAANGSSQFPTEQRSSLQVPPAGTRPFTTLRYYCEL